MNIEEKRRMVRNIINDIADDNNVIVNYKYSTGDEFTKFTFHYGGEEAYKRVYWFHLVDAAEDYTTYRLLRCIEKTIEHLKEDVDNTKKQIITSHNPYAERKVEENMDVASWYPKTITNSIYGSRAFAKYVENDLKSTTQLWEWVKANIRKGNYCYGVDLANVKPTPNKIKKVIFNPPATIVFWMDGTKTVVKAHGDDEYDPEKGMAMAFSKKFLGNEYEYYNVFKHWLKQWDKEFTVYRAEPLTEFDVLGSAAEATKNISESIGWVGEAAKRAAKTLSDRLKSDGEEEARKHDLIQKAYNELRGFCHEGKTTDLEEVLGYLGEVLND